MKNNIGYKFFLKEIYDNTIKYTDLFIDNIIETIQGKVTPSIIVYISDHGENLFDDSRMLSTHGSFSTQYQLKVPFIIYANTAFKRSYPKVYQNLASNINQEFQSQDLFHTLISLGDFKSNDYDSTLSLATTFYIKRPKYWVYDPYWKSSSNNLILYDSIIKNDSKYKQTKYSTSR